MGLNVFEMLKTLNAAKKEVNTPADMRNVLLQTYQSDQVDEFLGLTLLGVLGNLTIQQAFELACMD